MGTRHDQMVDKEIARNTEQYLKDRHEASVKLVKQFNDKFKGSIVYLKLTDEDSENSLHSAFQLHFNLNHDKLVESDIYNRGNAIIYPSEVVYKEIEKLAGKAKVSWNNTATIGWLSY